MGVNARNVGIGLAPKIRHGARVCGVRLASDPGHGKIIARKLIWLNLPGPFEI